MKRAFLWVAPILSGLLLSAAFPPWDLGFLSFFALVPLLYFTSRTTLAKAYFMGYLTGVILAGSFFLPLVMIDGFPLSGYGVIALVCGTYVAFFAVTFSFIRVRTGLSMIWIAPFLWVSIEFVRSNLFFLSNPGFILGYSLHGHDTLIQLASYTSVYGISFLVILVNAVAAEILIAYANRPRPEGYLLKLPPKIILNTGCVLVLLFFVFILGVYHINRGEQMPTEKIRVSLLQPNLSLHGNSSGSGPKTVQSLYGDLTADVSKDKPDLVVWPESSTPDRFPDDRQTFNQVVELVKGTGIPLVLGSSSRDKGNKRELRGLRLSNSAYFVNRYGQIESSYKKIRPVPFWEYLPLEGQFYWPKWLVPDHGNTLPGKQMVMFEFNGNRFGAVICWEILFPDTFRKFTRQSPDFMLNLSNESVFGWTAAPYKVQAMAVFRAIESRKSLLRCNLTGLTSHIDPWGRETAKVTDADGKDLMVQGYLTVDVPIMKGTTFYTRHGDVLAYLCVVWSIFLLFYTLVLSIREKHD